MKHAPPAFLGLRGSKGEGPQGLEGLLPEAPVAPGTSKDSESHVVPPTMFGPQRLQGPAPGSTKDPRAPRPPPQSLDRLAPKHLSSSAPLVRLAPCSLCTDRDASSGRGDALFGGRGPTSHSSTTAHDGCVGLLELRADSCFGLSVGAGMEADSDLSPVLRRRRPSSLRPNIAYQSTLAVFGPI
jgi:hypothetical protein